MDLVKIKFQLWECKKNYSESDRLVDVYDNELEANLAAEAMSFQTGSIYTYYVKRVEREEEC